MKASAYKTHALWGMLPQVSEALTQVDELGDADVSSSLEETRQLLAFSKSLQENDQTFLISTSALANLNNAWEEVRAGLAQYCQAPAQYEKYLNAARNERLDAVRNALQAFPRAEEAGVKKAATTRAATAYVEQIDEARRNLTDEIMQLRREREEREKAHAEEVNKLEVALSDLGTQIESLTSRISDDETRISTALTESNTAFNTSQTEREQRLKKWLEEQEDNFQELVKPHLSSIIDADNQAEASLKQIEGLRTSVVDMSNIAAGDILATEYGNSADKDRKAGYWGYAIGGLAGAAGIYILIFVFGSTTSGLDWPQLALKLGLTTGVGGIAAVAFRFGGQAFARATAFKRQELELRALTPFLQDVDGADAAKVSFVNQAFGKAWTPEQKANTASDVATDSSEVIKLLQTAFDTASKMVK